VQTKFFDVAPRIAVSYGQAIVLMRFFTVAQRLPRENYQAQANVCRGHLHGGAMKSPRRIRQETTMGELVSAIWEETETLFKSKKGERQLVVAYILNHLLTRPACGSHRIGTKKDSGERMHNRGTLAKPAPLG